MFATYVRYPVIHQSQQFHLFFDCFRFTLIQLSMEDILFYDRVIIDDNIEQRMWTLSLEIQQLSLISTDLQDFLGLINSQNTFRRYVKNCQNLWICTNRWV
jgi:hypothetical protein